MATVFVDVLVLLVVLISLIVIDPFVRRLFHVSKEAMKQEGSHPLQIKARNWIRYGGLSVMITIILLSGFFDKNGFSLLLLLVLFMMYVSYAWVDYKMAKQTNRYKMYLYYSGVIVVISIGVLYLFQKYQ